MARLGRTFITPHEGMLLMHAVGGSTTGGVGLAQFATLAQH